MGNQKIIQTDPNLMTIAGDVDVITIVYQATCQHVSTCFKQRFRLKNSAKKNMRAALLRWFPVHFGPRPGGQGEQLGIGSMLQESMFLTFLTSHVYKAK